MRLAFLVFLAVTMTATEFVIALFLSEMPISSSAGDDDGIGSESLFPATGIVDQ